MRALWIKDDRGNPTHSFKDRVVAVALAAATEMGFKVLACPSTGNLANAVAAAAARAGIRSVVMVPGRPGAAEDHHHRRLRRHVRHRGRHLRRREPAGLRARGRARRLGLRQRQRAAVLRRGVQDARLRDRRAARLAAARAGGGADRVRRPAGQDRQGLHRADLARPGARRRPWRVFGAQATGCSPVAAAFAAGHDVVRPVRPDTIAKSLAIGNPADGPYVLDVVRRTGGVVADVSDDEVVDAIRLLAGYRGHLRRDGRRRHPRRAAQAARRTASSTRRPRP